MSNREIKFRVWNKRTNNWVHGPGHEINLFGETILLGGFMRGIGLEELNDCVALQYTGMKDKNGKEIYEGDFVSQKQVLMDAGLDNEYHLTEYIKGAIYFAAGTFFVDNGGPLYSQVYSNTPDILSEFEVIGNRFENPNLLE